MRCQTVTNYTLRNNPKWIAILEQHEVEPDTIFCTDYLTDRLFTCGFRIVNPEFNASVYTLADDQAKLRDILNDWDAQNNDEFHNYKPNTPMTPKQRAEWKHAAGLDR